MQIQTPKEVASELRRTSYRHTLWKLMYTIQDYTCYHQWTATKLDKHTQSISRIHMGTYLIQLN